MGYGMASLTSSLHPSAEGHKPARAGDAASTDGQRDPSDMMSKTRDPEGKIGMPFSVSERDGWAAWNECMEGGKFIGHSLLSHNPWRTVVWTVMV